MNCATFFGRSVPELVVGEGPARLAAEVGRRVLVADADGVVQARHPAGDVALCGERRRSRVGPGAPAEGRPLRRTQGPW